MYKGIFAQAPFLLPLLALLSTIHQKVIERGTHSPIWLETLRIAMTGDGPLSLAFQLHLLFAAQLFCLYGLYVNRKSEVFIYSHLRFILATFCVSAVGALYYRGFIMLSMDVSITTYLLIAIAAIAAMRFSGVLQAAIVVGFDALGQDPIVRDLTRSMEVGKIGDFNSWIIRRWGQFILFWFLLLPGCVLHAPIPPWLKIVLVLIASIWPTWSFLSSSFWYVR